MATLYARDILLTSSICATVWGMDSRLLSPDPKVTAAAFTKHLLEGIKAKEDETTRSKEPLIPWTFRSPNSVLEDLKKAAKKHNTTMTAIVLAALADVLPVLLTDGPPTRNQEAELQHFVELLRQALPQVIAAPQTVNR